METSATEYERLLQFLYQCPVGIAEMDPAGTLVMLNALGSQLLMPLMRSDSGGNFFTLLDPHAPELRQMAEAYHAPSGSICEHHRVACVLAAVQPPRTVYLSFTLLKLHAQSLMAVFSDVSKAVADEIKIRQAIETQALQQGKLEIAASVLHDIGNAITGIGTRTAQLMGDTNWSELHNLQRLQSLLEAKVEAMTQVLGPGKGAALVEFVQATVTALTQRGEEWEASMRFFSASIVHIQEIISIQRQYVRNGMHGARPQLDVREVVQDALTMQLGGFAKRGIRICTDLPATPQYIQGDRTRLIQVFVNIFKNACEAFDELGTTEKTLAIHLAHVETQRVRITICDNAIGFLPEQAESFFAPYASTKQRGSGLGLSHCRSIIEAHGGSIGMESQGPGTGATVILELPRIIQASSSYEESTQHESSGH